MKELQKGFMSDEDMADWCDKDLKNFKAHKSRWSSTQLIKFCEFEIIKGKGYNITKIMDPIYHSSAKKEVKDKWYNYWGYNGNKLDSNKECFLKLKASGLTNPISDSAGFCYTSGSKCEGFGSARRNCKKRRGTRGYCKYTYCIIVNGVPQHFDDSDYHVKSELEDKYLGTTYKEQKYEMHALYSEYKRGELTKEEYEESLDFLVEFDLGWNEYEQAFNEYLKEKYGDEAYADFRQELVEDTMVAPPSPKEGKFDF